MKVNDLCWYSMFPGEASPAVIVGVRGGLMGWIFGTCKIRVTEGHSVGFETWCDPRENIYPRSN